jgi:hypothetical protein
MEKTNILCIYIHSAFVTSILLGLEIIIHGKKPTVRITSA